MRKVLLASMVLILLAFFCVSCGDSNPIVPPQVNAFGFLQEVAGQSYMFTPVLGKFTTTGGNTTFSATPVKDPATNQTIKAEIWSLILSAKGDKVVMDLYGGTEENPSDQWDIWVGNSDGTGLTQVTNDEYTDVMPQFSPDGTKVVYNSYRGCDVFCGSFSVVRNVNGSGEVVLPIPEGTASTWAPTFSPDGSKIAVEIWGYNETLGEFDGIFIMDADGANQQMLTNPWAEADMWDEVPSFTKDGTQIVFSREDHSSETFSEHVYIMNVDGTGVTALSSGATINNDPLILGDRILFNSSRDNPDSARGTGFEIYTMNLDGTGITRLTNNALFDGFCGEYYESEGTSAAHYQQLRPAKRLHH